MSSKCYTVYYTLICNSNPKTIAIVSDKNFRLGCGQGGVSDVYLQL